LPLARRHRAGQGDGGPRLLEAAGHLHLARRGGDGARRHPFPQRPPPPRRRPAAGAEGGRGPGRASPVRRLGLAAVAAVAIATGALAVAPDEKLADPALEARARALSAELRCMVCQNQSIDDSDAPLAHDLRVLLRERLAAGDSDAEVVDFLVARYGEFILLTPRLSVQTALLWAAPVVLLVLGGVVAFGVLRRRPLRDAPAVAGLTDEERAELDRILSKPG